MGAQVGAWPGHEAREGPSRDDRMNPFQWFRQGFTQADEAGLSEGQIVCVAARWVLVGSGLLLAIWNPAEIGRLRVQVLVLLVIAVANFYLHAQLLRKRPSFAPVACAASVADLIVVTTLVLTQGGFESNLWVFYIPAVLALSVAFPPALTALFLGATIVNYGVLCLGDSGWWHADDGPQVLFIRVLMIAAIGVCGAMFRVIEGQRQQPKVSLQSSDVLHHIERQ